MTLRTLALFAGIAGLERGLHMVCDCEVVATAEIDPWCIGELTRLWGARNFGDVRDESWADLKGKVDMITAGFPCQPASVAGKRKGRDDERWLWPEVARAARALEPGYLFLENVPGLTTVDNGAGFWDIITDLRALGYVGRTLSIRASDVGAPHRRERLFILAHHPRQRLQGLWPGRFEQLPPRPPPPEFGSAGEVVEHADGAGLPGRARSTAAVAHRNGAADGLRFAGSADVGDGQYQRFDRRETGGREGRREQLADAGAELEYAAQLGRREGRAESAREQGRHDATQPGRAFLPEYDPYRIGRGSWSDGVAALGFDGTIRLACPDVCPLADPRNVKDRVAQLRAYGNAVVPTQAAAALTLLAEDAA